MRTELKVTVASRARVIVPTHYRNYDLTANPYVGCAMACSFCFVRHYLKDEEKDWGEFVRVREHVKEKVPKELQIGYFSVPDGRHDATFEPDNDGNLIRKKGKQKYKRINNEDARLVIGSMTDPFQPLERKHRITRAMLQIIIATKPQLNKVGIFTRSPIILDDLDLVVQLPRKRVHYTLSPFTPEIMHLLEPIAIQTQRRFDTIRALKQAGVRCHVSVAPAIPIISEPLVTAYAEQLADIGVDEMFIDPMQAYGESWEAMKHSLQGHQLWPRIEEIMMDKANYQEWKMMYHQQWRDAWQKVQHKSPHTLVILSDHIHHTWVDMKTGEQMDLHRYGDDLEIK